MHETAVAVGPDAGRRGEVLLQGGWAVIAFVRVNEWWACSRGAVEEEAAVEEWRLLQKIP